ncbi:hypothetical protein LCGC14_2686650, partial [marine sediment metagenome]
FGSSDLLRVVEWIDNYKEYLRDSVIINKLYRSPMIDITIKDAGKSEVNRAIRRYSNFEIGSNPVHNDRESWKIMEFTGANVSQQEARRAILLMVAAGVGFPEFFFGDGSNSNLACHDEETEVLTKRGWIKHAETIQEDEVACFDPTTESMVWEQPTKIHSYDHEGELVEIKTRNLDICVTPNHRIWTKYDRKHLDVKNPSRPKQPKGWHFKTADELGRSDLKRHLLAQTAKANCEDLESITVPGCERATRPDCPDIDVDANSFLEFLGWWVAEGGTNGGENYPGVHTVYLSQRTPSKIPIIDACLARLPWGFCRVEQTDTGSVRWSVGNKSLFGWLREMCGSYSPEKRLPDFCLDLGKRQSRILLDALILGDGTLNETNAQYRTTSKLLADQVQVLAIRCGYAAMLYKSGVVSNGPIPHIVWQVGIRLEKIEVSVRRTN